MGVEVKTQLIRVIGRLKDDIPGRGRLQKYDVSCSQSRVQPSIDINSYYLPTSKVVHLPVQLHRINLWTSVTIKYFSS